MTEREWLEPGGGGGERETCGDCVTNAGEKESGRQTDAHCELISPLWLYDQVDETEKAGLAIV